MSNNAYEELFGVPKGSPVQKSNNITPHEELFGVPSSSKVNENENESSDIINNLPFPIGKLFKIGRDVTKSFYKPDTLGSENIIGMGRGAKDVGEGLKQLYLEKFGNEGEAEKHTKEAQKEREFYKATPAGQNEITESVRDIVNTLPYMALGGPLAASGHGVLAKMLAGGLGTGGIGYTKFVPEGESRLGNAVKEGAVGAAIPAVLDFPELAQKVMGHHNPLLDAKKIENELLTTNKQKEFESATEKHELAKESYEETKNKAKNEGISTDHEKLIHTINEHDKAINEAKMKSQELQKNLEELPEPPKQPEPFKEQNIVKPEKKEFTEPEKPKLLGKEHEEYTKEADNQYLKAEDNVVRVKKNIDEIKKLDEQSEKNTGKYLQSGASHAERLPKIIRHDLKELKSEGELLYDEIQKETSDKGIIVKNSKTAKELNADFIKVLEKEKGAVHKSKEAQSLLNEIDKVNNQEVIPAAQYMSNIKAVKGYMRDAFKRANKPLINEDQRLFYKDQAYQAKLQLEKMNDILHESIGNTSYKKVLEANDFWKKNIIPLWKQPLYWKIMAEETMPSNMAHKLSGGREGSGKEIIRNIVKNNPQAVKHVVGQRYDINKSSIYNPNELMKQYTDKLPELKKLVNQKKSTEEMIRHSESNVNLAIKNKDTAKRIAVKANNEAIRARNENRRIQSEYKSKLKEHKENLANQTKEEKDYDKRISDYEKYKVQHHEKVEKYGIKNKEYNKKVSKAEKDMDDNIKEIDRLIESKSKNEKHHKILNKSFNEKGISLKEKNKLGKELDLLIKERKQINEDLVNKRTGIPYLTRNLYFLYRGAKKYLGIGEL